MTKIQLRRGTPAAWTAANSVLSAGEPGVVTDSGRQKIGDGTTAWNSLPFATERQRTYNVKDYGAVGDGVAVDTTAIQAAITAAGVGGRVFFPPGLYVSGALTVPNWATLCGSANEFGASSTATTELRFPSLTGSAVAITMGVNGAIQDLLLRGPGSTVGTVSGVSCSTMRARGACIRNFYVGVKMTGGVLSQFYETEFNRNGTGLLMSGCFNVGLYGPRFWGEDSGTYNVGISGDARGLSIFGGSFESYSTAINISSASHLTVLGTYFESIGGTNSVAINAASKNKVSVHVDGCMVYLNNHASFVTTLASTNTSLTATANHFSATEGSTSTPVAYITSSVQSVFLSADNWTEVAKTGATYVSPAGTVTGARVDWPLSSGTYASMTTDGRRSWATQTLASNGAVTLDSSKTDNIITLNANATSSSFSAAPGGTTQLVTVTWIQDSTGGRTYAWPSTCKFAGNSAPSDTTLSRQTSVTFRYDSSTGKYWEVSRAVAVGP